MTGRMTVRVDHPLIYEIDDLVSDEKTEFTSRADVVEAAMSESTLVDWRQ